MVFFAVCDRAEREVFDFFDTRAEAERALDEVLKYEPGWIRELELALVDIGGERLQITPL